MPCNPVAALIRGMGQRVISAGRAGEFAHVLGRGAGHRAHVRHGRFKVGSRGDARRKGRKKHPGGQGNGQQRFRQPQRPRTQGSGGAVGGVHLPRDLLQGGGDHVHEGHGCHDAENLHGAKIAAWRFAFRKLCKLCLKKQGSVFTSKSTYPCISVTLVQLQLSR